MIFDSVTFIMSSPKFIENTKFIYKVFEPNVWFVFSCFLIGFVTMVHLIPKINLNGINTNEDYFWFALQILLRQSIVKLHFKTMSMQLLFAFWLSLCFSLSAFYSNTIYS